MIDILLQPYYILMVLALCFVVLEAMHKQGLLLFFSFGLACSTTAFIVSALNMENDLPTSVSILLSIGLTIFTVIHMFRSVDQQNH